MFVFIMKLDGGKAILLFKAALRLRLLPEKIGTGRRN